MAPYRLNPLFVQEFDESKWQESRPLLELNARCAVGAILDKKQWWLKWTDRPDVRAKWLSEIQHAFVAKSVLDVLSCWPVSGQKEVLYRQVKGAMETLDVGVRRQQLEAACRQVRYIEDWADDDEEREVQHFPRNGGVTNAALELLANAGTENMPPVRGLYSYGQVAWYMHEWVHIQQVRALNVETMTREDVDTVFNDNELVARRAADLVMAVSGNNLTLAGLREALGSPQEHNEEALLSILMHVAMIHVGLGELPEYVTESIGTVLDHLSGKSFAAVQECFQSDTAIPDELKHRLLRGVARLEDVPADQQDWHPHANHQVLDIVHPSLFCGVYGLTKVVDASESASGLDAAAAMKKLIGGRSSMLENPFKDQPSNRSVNAIKFQWLPSEFEIDANGEVHIRSYINNLHPEDHSEVYQTIAQIFGRFVPLFSLCLGSLAGAVPPRLIENYRLSRLHRCELPLIHGSLPWDAGLGEPLEGIALSGTTLQVIVKIAEIVLTPENPKYAGGSWHIEGTAVENIVATGIYYFTSENVTESKLAFRAQVKEPGYSQHDNLGVAAMFGLHDEKALAQNVGAVTTSEDRCLVFPNVLQHKVQPFELADKSKPGVRKILCFFLVDPSKKIPSTAQIAPQQSEWISRIKREQLQQARELPEPVVATVLSMAQEGLTREQAEAFRLELMDERSPQKTTEGQTMHFSLCEH